jgi:hypothetical protein
MGASAAHYSKFNRIRQPIKPLFENLFVDGRAAAIKKRSRW